jgi:threonine aldolase
MRKGLGGGLRQAGVIAAAALYSLDNIVPKLYVDNNNASQIAKGNCLIVNCRNLL